MNLGRFCVYLFLCGLVFGSGQNARADHIPENILKEIMLEMVVPGCLNSNQYDGTDLDCYNPYSDYVDCWVEILHNNMTYQQAVDLLDQMKLNKRTYGHVYGSETNPSISAEDIDLLGDADFICWF